MLLVEWGEVFRVGDTPNDDKLVGGVIDKAAYILRPGCATSIYRPVGVFTGSNYAWCYKGQE